MIEAFVAISIYEDKNKIEIQVVVLEQDYRKRFW